MMLATGYSEAVVICGKVPGFSKLGSFCILQKDFPFGTQTACGQI